MTEHTVFIMSCQLKPDTPTKVVETLRYMTSLESIVKHSLRNPPNHPYFETKVWESMLFAAGGPLWDAGSTLVVDPDNNALTLNIRASVTDYEKQIAKFLHWLAPYCACEGFVGYIQSQYENEPTRILMENGQCFLVEPVSILARISEYDSRARTQVVRDPFQGILSTFETSLN